MKDPDSKLSGIDGTSQPENSVQTEECSTKSSSMYVQSSGQSKYEYTLRKYREVIVTFLSGFTAGMVSRTITAPLDRLKLLMQEGRILQHTMIHPTCHISNKNIRNNANYNYSISQLIRIILRDGDTHKDIASRSTSVDGSGRKFLEHVRSLFQKVSSVSVFWRGNGINCIKAGPEFALAFGTRQMYQQLLVSESKSSHITPQCSSFTSQFIISAAAGATAQVVVYPLELIKTRMAVAGSAEFTSIADCVRQTYRKGFQNASLKMSMESKSIPIKKNRGSYRTGAQKSSFDQTTRHMYSLSRKQKMQIRISGLSEFYRGMGANLAGIVPNRGVEMGLFFWLQDIWKQYAVTSPAMKEKANAPLSTKMSMLIGAASSTTAQVVTYPLNLIRLRMQVQGMSGRPIIYRNMMHCFMSILRKEGYIGLYRGLLPNLLKGVPSSTTMYVIFSTTKNFLNERIDSKDA